MRKPIPPTPENVRQALGFVSPSCDRKTWIKILSAIKNGLGEEGKEIADQWSQEGDSYKKSDFRDAWKSIEAVGDVTIASLWDAAKKAGWKPGDSAYEEPESARMERERRKTEANKRTAEDAAQKRGRAALALRKILTLSQPCQAFPYLTGKGVSPPPGLFQADAREVVAVRSFGPNIKPEAGQLLLIPMAGPDGEPCGLEAIDATGAKGYLAGCSKGSFIIGAIQPGEPVAIVEGLATGLSVHHGAGLAVAVAFDSGGLRRVAGLIRGKHPSSPVLICGDRGNGQKEAENAAQATGSRLAIPDFTGLEISEKDTDFNDLHRLAGLESVAKQINAALAAAVEAQPTAPQPAEPLTAPPQAASQPSAVIDYTEENAARLAYEARIKATEDSGALTYGLAVEIQRDRLRTATKTMLLKQIARKTGANLETLRDLAPMEEGADVGRGRADPKFLPYKTHGNQLYLIDREGERPLCNFVAWISEEVIFDDGLSEDCLFRIEGCLSDGVPLPAIEVPAPKFAGLGWVTAQWGARPLVHAGNTIKDHLRTAIQGLSKDYGRRTVYGHTGWRKLNGRWAFLHAGGAIFEDSISADIEVRAGEGNMRRYAFDGGGGDLAEAVRASLKLLDIAPSNPCLGVALLAATYRAPTYEAAIIDHSLFLAGQSGSRKSEASAMALAHFGRGFDARHFPANFEDSISDMEAKGNTAKDCVFVVDDFKPRGAPSDVTKLHSIADRLFRGVGNQGTRGRRTSDMRQRPSLYARGMTVASGEDIPKGGSLRARMAVVEVSLDDIDNAALSELQESARAGLLERAMLGYLQWLAPSMDEYKTALPAHLRGFRDQANREGFARSHDRAADIYASLLIGLDLFIQYAVHVGAVDSSARAALYERCGAALKAMIAGQSEYQADQDEVTQFFGFLRSALAGGLCHFADYLTQGAPKEHPYFWGWRTLTGAEEGAPSIEKPQGEKVGWVDAVRIYMNGDLAFAAAQELAKSTGDNLTITQRTLWKRLHERGLLKETIQEKHSGKQRFKLRRTIAGASQEVLILDRMRFEQPSF